VDYSNWGFVNSALNGAGVESMQAKWEEMFGEKEEEVVEEKKVKKPRRKAVVDKKESMKKSSTKEQITAESNVQGKTSPRKKTT